MSDQKKVFQVSIDLVTHAKMVKHSRNSYRTVRKQVEHDLKEMYKNISLSADDLRFFELGEKELKNYPDLIEKLNQSKQQRTPETADRIDSNGVKNLAPYNGPWTPETAEKSTDDFEFEL